MTAETHSPLGASSASRWLKCPGSVPLSVGIDDEDDDIFSKPGTAAHDLAANCLTKRAEAWTMIGATLLGTGIKVDKEMADAVQVYLDAIREQHPDRDQGNSWVEWRFHCPNIHEKFFGTADFVYFAPASGEVDRDPIGVLHVWDFKYGAGIVVEVEKNVQCMYYAAGALEDLELWMQVDEIVLHIAQPRAFHGDGPIREWRISTDDLLTWLEDELIPAMDRAGTATETTSGEHCRFCPVRRYACPQLLKDATEAEDFMKTIEQKGGAEKLTNEEVARFLDLLDVMKIAGKAAAETAVARLQNGQEIAGRKLVKSKANREWKDDAEPAITEKFGKQAYTEPALKSPAQIDKLPEGTSMTARYAFKPDTGYTLAKGADTRAAVSKSVKTLFANKGA